jgi:hypothetical protein
MTPQDRLSETEHPEADCTCPFCEAMRVAQGAYENMDAYAKRLRGERDTARQQRDTFARALKYAVRSHEVREAHIRQAERALLEERCAEASRTSARGSE